MSEKFFGSESLSKIRKEDALYYGSLFIPPSGVMGLYWGVGGGTVYNREILKGYI
jgi:hypothetical protein